MKKAAAFIKSCLRPPSAQGQDKGTRSDRNQGCDVCPEYPGMASVLPNEHDFTCK